MGSLSFTWVTLSLLCIVNGYDYCGMDLEHVMCRWPRSGNQRHCYTQVMSPARRQTFLHTLNIFRDDAACLRRRPIPPAANMKKMQWNNELQTIAERYLSLCEGFPEELYKKVNFNSKDFKVALFFIEDKADTQDWETAMEAWRKDAALITESPSGNYAIFEQTPEGFKVASLFNTDGVNVGCGVIRSYPKKSKSALCLVGPSPEPESALYTIGEPASQCPEEMQKDGLYSGLCGHEKGATLPSLSATSLLLIVAALRR